MMWKQKYEALQLRFQKTKQQCESLQQENQQLRQNMASLQLQLDSAQNKSIKTTMVSSFSSLSSSSSSTTTSSAIARATGSGHDPKASLTMHGSRLLEFEPPAEGVPRGPPYHARLVLAREPPAAGRPVGQPYHARFALALIAPVSGVALTLRCAGSSAHHAHSCA